MAEEWKIDGPRVLDIGGEAERVRRLKVGIVGGHIDVVTHDDSPAARLEVSGVEGEPLRVRWDGSTLKITHGKDSEGILDRITFPFSGMERNKVFISLSIPEDASASVSTVSAGALVAGIHAAVKTNTVSGALALDDIVGPTDINTVSGDVECHQLEGPLKVKSVSGSVTAQLSRLPSVTVHTVSGDIALDLTNSEATISSTSVSGDITVRSPHDGYRVSANTASGQVVVDGRELRRGPHAPGGELTEGDGALRVKANAVSGNVVVLRPGGSVPADDDSGEKAV
jgi:Putative adhesin